MDIVNDNNTTIQPTKQNSTTEKHPDSLLDITPEVGDAPLIPEGVSTTPVKILPEHKDAFLKSIATGERYKENFSLFNGSIKLRLRCRSIDESDALMAYIRQQSLMGNLSTDYEYQSLIRLLLLIPQVERLNDIEFPEMEKPLFSTVNGLEKVPPAWVGRLEFWRNKPEALVSSISSALAQFETRYWAMIKASSDINFWQPGQSTGQ